MRRGQLLCGRLDAQLLEPRGYLTRTLPSPQGQCAAQRTPAGCAQSWGAARPQVLGARLGGRFAPQGMASSEQLIGYATERVDIIARVGALAFQLLAAGIGGSRGPIAGVR